MREHVSAVEAFLSDNGEFLVTLLFVARTLLVPMRGCAQCESRSRPNTSEKLAPHCDRARKKKRKKKRECTQTREHFEAAWCS